MTEITLTEEEFRRLKEKAGEPIKDDRDPEHCRLHGHTWKMIGGANAGCCDTCSCSVDVHECIVCKDCDYGDTPEAIEVRAHCDQLEGVE